MIHSFVDAQTLLMNLSGFSEYLKSSPDQCGFQCSLLICSWRIQQRQSGHRMSAKQGCFKAS